MEDHTSNSNNDNIKKHQGPNAQNENLNQLKIGAESSESPVTLQSFKDIHQKAEKGFIVEKEFLNNITVNVRRPKELNKITVVCPKFINTATKQEKQQLQRQIVDISSVGAIKLPPKPTILPKQFKIARKSTAGVVRNQMSNVFIKSTPFENVVVQHGISKIIQQQMKRKTDDKMLSLPKKIKLTPQQVANLKRFPENISQKLDDSQTQQNNRENTSEWLILL